MKRMAVLRDEIEKNYTAPRSPISGADLARNLLNDLASAPDPQTASQITRTALIKVFRDRVGMEGFANILTLALLKGSA